VGGGGRGVFSGENLAHTFETAAFVDNYYQPSSITTQFYFYFI
jgi:hypothetical protein